MLSVIGRKSLEKNYETNCKKQFRIENYSEIDP